MQPHQWTAHSIVFTVFYFLSLSKDNPQVSHVSEENIITITASGRAIAATLVCPRSLTLMEVEMTCHLR